MLIETETTVKAAAILPSGKDEMNFAEFPIALLSDRAPKDQKSIKFEDQVYDERRKKLITRKRVIEGSEEYGLPTATDDTVILALIQLTKLKSDFTLPEVEFTRLELIRLLGWPNEGKSYDRIKLSLLRIKAVNYIYDNAWWDARQKKWTTRAFNIIDNVEINDSRATNGQSGLFPSRIVWNEVVFDSFQTGFLRNIDFQLCMRLEHPTALRMYRFLGKRFYLKPDWTFDLKEFAYEHIGLGRNYEGGTQIARKLQPAINELESVGFLEPLPAASRFLKSGRDWSIRFVKKSAPLPSSLPDNTKSVAAELSPLVAELTSRGVSDKIAADLVRDHDAEVIRQQIEILDWRLTGKKADKIDDPAAWLVSAIKNPHAVPKGFESAAQRERNAAAIQQRQQAEADELRRKRLADAQEQADRTAFDRYVKQLSKADRAALEAKALAAANLESRTAYDDPAMGRFRDTLLLGMLREYLRPILRQKPDTEA